MKEDHAPGAGGARVVWLVQPSGSARGVHSVTHSHPVVSVIEQRASVSNQNIVNACAEQTQACGFLKERDRVTHCGQAGTLS